MFNLTKDKVIQPPTTTKSKVKHIHPNLAWLCRQHGVLVWVIAKTITFTRLVEIRPGPVCAIHDNIAVGAGYLHYKFISALPK